MVMRVSKARAARASPAWRAVGLARRRPRWYTALASISQMVAAQANGRKSSGRARVIRMVARKVAASRLRSQSARSARSPCAAVRRMALPLAAVRSVALSEPCRTLSASGVRR